MSLGGAFSWYSKLFLQVRSRGEAGEVIFGSVRFAWVFCCAVVSLEAVVLRVKNFEEQQVFHLGY